MQRTLLLLSVLFFVGVGASAQNNSASPLLGVGLSYGAPLGTNSSTTPYAAGLIIRLQEPVNNRLSLLFKTGYSSYFAGDVSLGSFNPDNEYDDSPATGTIWSFVPMELGAKLYLVDKLYIEGDAGVSFFLNYHPGENKTVEPIVAAALGYDIPFKGSKNSLDLGFGYENRIYHAGYFTDFSQIPFHVIFNFGL
jgi:hypothetical protein